MQVLLVHKKKYFSWIRFWHSIDQYKDEGILDKARVTMLG
jgi:hypothetical protein